VSKKTLDYGILKELLPEQLLDRFEIVSYQLVTNKESGKLDMEICLDEQNILPEDCQTTDYESKGFLPSSRVQDFPIRGKAVYLIIRRRRWRHKQTKKEVNNDYSFVAEGSRLTQELSDFLKGTGRDTRRYH